MWITLTIAYERKSGVQNYSFNLLTINIIASLCIDLAPKFSIF